MNKALMAPLIYYDLLDRPLTALEVYKYLRAETPGISFFSLWQELKSAKKPVDPIGQKNGLYFLAGRQELIKIRDKRLKLAQTKWRKLKAAGKYLALVPFLRLVAVTGSLTAYNTKESSDFDLLIVIEKNRLWLGRLLLTGFVGAVGKRRHGQLTQNRICLNCYLTKPNLEITTEAKPRDFHSAQEYGRLTSIVETSPGLYKNFIQANMWLAQLLKNYPWPNERNANKIKPAAIFNIIRRFFERVIGGKIGDKLEKISGKLQTKRISKKRQNEQSNADQIFVSDTYLMFHPQSKSDRLMKEFDFKIEQLQKTKN